MNERDEERQFLEGLKARTGRDLAGWMAAIGAQGFGDKNEIIDWLRSQGFPFARASWLERIHRNGGKPIQAVTPALPAGGPLQAPAPLQPPAPPRVLPFVASPVPPRQTPPAPALAIAATPPVPAPSASATAPSASATGGPPAAAVPPAAQPQPAAQPAAAPAAKAARGLPPLVEPARESTAMEKLLGAAKGYRPLYNFLEAQIRKTIPGVVIAARGRYIAIGAPREFAAVTVHPTEVRLGLDLGDRPFDTLLQRAKLKGPGAAISHMIVLTDARQVGTELLALAETANGRVNAPA